MTMCSIESILNVIPLEHNKNIKTQKCIIFVYIDDDSNIAFTVIIFIPINILIAFIIIVSYLNKIRYNLQIQIWLYKSYLVLSSYMFLYFIHFHMKNLFIDLFGLSMILTAKIQLQLDWMLKYHLSMCQ